MAYSSNNIFNKLTRKDIKMKTYYFTFGFNQEHENCFTKIEAENYSKAREIMVERFGLEWAFQYGKKQWFNEKGVSQQEIFNLKEIKYFKGIASTEKYEDKIFKCRNCREKYKNSFCSTEDIGICRWCNGEEE